MPIPTADALLKAKASTSLTTGNTPFVTGVKFTITGFTYEQNATAAYPVFETNIGTLSVAQLIRPKSVKPYLDKNTNEMIFVRQSDGTFHTELRRILNENHGKTNDEIMPLLVAAAQGRTLVVRKREFVTVEGKFGDTPSAILHIDFVTE